MNRPFLQKGYSLLELVIYIALFTLFSIVIIRSLVTVTQTYATAAAYRRLQNNGELIMERITREARNASSISNGTYGTNPGAVTFVGTDTDDVSHTVSFAVVNGAIQVTDNGVSSNISTTEVSPTSFIVRHITTADGEGVKVELQLTTANGYIVSAPFYSTIMLRE